MRFEISLGKKIQSSLLQDTWLVSQFGGELVLDVPAAIPVGLLIRSQDFKLSGGGAAGARTRALGVFGVGAPELAHEVGDHPVEVDTILTD